MLKSYPATNHPDSREYVTALAGTICQYPRQIAEACVHPITGVVRECVFKPTVADIERWCTNEAHPLFDRYASAMEVARVANEVAHAAKVKCEIERGERPSLDPLRAQHRPNWGLKTIDDIDLVERREQQSRRDRERFDRMALAEYAALGIDPVYTSGGTLVSPSLLRSIDRMPTKPADTVRQHG